MSTPRVIVDDTLPVERIVVTGNVETDPTSRIVVSSEDLPGVTVTNTGDDITVTIGANTAIGPQGATGATGATGPIGATGYTGSKGATGQANVGNVVPTSSDSGSFWLDTDTGILSLNVGDYGNTVWISVSY